MGLTVTAMGLEKKTKKHELKKHVATIHCSNTLTLLQRKISNALLFHAYKELLENEEHEISVSQLCKLIEYNGNNHRVIKDALRSLLSTVIEWNVVNDTGDAENWTASSILASVSLQGPSCYYAYSPRMKQLLHSPSMFGKINLYIQSRFKSSYGLALYENCIRYRGLPQTKWFDMETFRKLMGVPDGNYIIFRDFKRRVLDKAIEEVNTYSDILVELELVRERRKVTKIRFILKERAKKTRIGTNSNFESEEFDEETMVLRNKLIREFALSPKQTEKVLSDYDKTFIQEKINVVESSKNYIDGKVKNLAAYFMSALKNDYQAQKESNNLQQDKKREQDITAENLKELQQIAESIESSYKRFKEKLIDKCIKKLNDNTKTKFLENFQKYAEGPIKTILKLQKSKYNQDNIFESPQISGLLREFAIRTLPKVKVMPIEKYLKRFSEEKRNAWHQFKLVETHIPEESY